MDDADADRPTSPGAASIVSDVDASPRGALAEGLAKSVGQAFAGSSENLKEVFSMMFDVVQKQQVVIGSTRDELDSSRAEQASRFRAFEDELERLRGELAEARAWTAAPAPASGKPFSVVVGSLPQDHDDEDLQSMLDSHADSVTVSSYALLRGAG